MNTIAASSPSVREMAIVAFRYKRAIAIAFLLPVAVAIALAMTAEKIYQADSKILVRAGREYVAAAETGQNGAIPPSSTMQEAIDTEVEILTSRDVLREVVAAVGVERLYPKLANAEPTLYGRIMARLAFGSNEPRGENPLENQAIKALAEDLKVRPIKLSNVVELSVRNPDPAIAAEALNKLLTVFRAHHIAAFSRQRSSSLDEQMTRNLTEIAGLEKERSEYANDHRLFAAGEQRTALIQQKARLAQDLQEVRLRRASLEEQVRYLGTQIRKQPRTVRLETQTQPSSATAETEKNLQALKAKEGLYAAHFRPESAMLRDVRTAIAAHEQVLATTRDASSVRTGVNPILQNLETQNLTAATELAPLQGKEADLSAAIAETDERLRGVGTAELRLMGLDRRIAQLNTATVTLNQRLDDARFLDDLDRQHLTSVKTIDNAAARDRPVSLGKSLYAAAGLFCGLIAGFGAFLMALTFRNRFLSVEMTERVLGIHVVAAMPLMTARQVREGSPAAYWPKQGRIRMAS